MIVIIARFETDGDYCIDNAKAGLTSPPDDDYCHGGLFLCADTDEAGAILERLFKGIDANGYLWQKFVQMFAEAQSALDDFDGLDVLRNGWLKQIGGNYEGTLLFMQEVTNFPVTPKKPILRNNDQFKCEINECPTCGHIVEGEESGEKFRYCPQCGQAIDWKVTA